MPPPIRQHSSLTIVVITIGITQVQAVRIIPVGSQRRRYTILVQQVGVFLMVEVKEYGQRRVFQVLLLMKPTGVYPSASAVLQPLGTLLRVISTSAMGRCTLSAAASIGQLLLTIATLATCTSTTMAASIHPAATVGRTGLGSVASKNPFD